ncbi:MAG TPA: hypothetical protein VGJ61_00140 [Solirubrobacterales bacterium]
MGILDDAIREHLDLKRKHGARDAELREIEDEAFGSTDQPDPFAAGELFNEVASGGAAEAGGEEPTRLVESEARRPLAPEPEESTAPAPQGRGPSSAAEESISPIDEPVSPPEGLGQIPGQVELPGQDEIPGQERFEEPESYRPSTEPESRPTTEPESSESLEALIAEEEPFPEDAAAPPPAPAEHAAPEAAAPAAPPPEPPVAPPPEAPVAPEPEAPAPPEPEPESSVPDPPPPPPDTGPEPPGRARGRVDVPTEEHPPPGDTGGLPPLAEREPEPEAESFEPAGEPPPPDEPPSDEAPGAPSDGLALYDFETDEDSLSTDASVGETDDDFAALGPAEEEAPYLEEEEPYAEEPVSGTEEAPFEEPNTAVRPALEDEDAYEGGSLDPEEGYEEEEAEEGLWFEKGPPKDFDFDDD